MKSTTRFIAIAAAAFVGTAGVASAQTLEKVKKAGTLSCGVNTGLAGFSAPDDKGNWTGLDVEYCRAIAAAVLGDAKKVRFVPTKLRPSELSRASVHVVLRLRTSISPDCSAVKRSLAVVGTKRTFFASPRTAAATARQ